jgi:Cd(II)/Pb(II)-responsive transcriptional regulator
MAMRRLNWPASYHRHMKIGELARAASTPVETIRYYEREGLLPEAPRTHSNYRVYGDEQVDRLAFIRHCRSLDMTLEEIRVLLRFKDAPAEDCGTVNRLLDEHIGHVEGRIRELRSLQKQLRSLRDQCLQATSAADCGILSGLTREASAMEAEASQPSSQLGHVHGTHRAQQGRQEGGAGRGRKP